MRQSDPAAYSRRVDPDAEDAAAPRALWPRGRPEVLVVNRGSGVTPPPETRRETEPDSEQQRPPSERQGSAG